MVSKSSFKTGYGIIQTKLEMEISKQEMEILKQEMELFLKLPELWIKMVLIQIFSIQSEDCKTRVESSKWNYPNRK